MAKTNDKPTFSSPQDECNYLYKQAIIVLDMVEVAGVAGTALDRIKFKLLNLANDVKRLPTKYKVGE